MLHSILLGQDPILDIPSGKMKIQRDELEIIFPGNVRKSRIVFLIGVKNRNLKFQPLSFQMTKYIYNVI